MQQLDHALAYAARGLPVFPCRCRESSDPDTGEVYGAKTPLTPNGLKGATTTERIIRVWWDRSPDAMIGLPTGAKAGFFVLDVDNKPGGANGFDWLDEMEALHGALPTTARVRTPNSGVHILFNYVAGTRNRGALGDGVDIRSEGGYVVAAGSVMGDGRRYEWVDAEGAPVAEMPPIADAPEWLLALVLKPAPEPAHHAAHYGAPYQAGQNEPYVNAAVSRELDTLAASPQGSRNNDLNDAAFALGQFVGAGALSRGEAEAALFSVASAWPNHKLSLGTIKRGLDSGQQNPRAIPERADTPVDNTTLRSIKNIIKSAAATAGTQERMADDEAAAGVDDEPLSSNMDARPDSAQDSAHTEPPAPPPTPEPTPPADEPFFATPFKWIDPSTLPRREFAFGTHYIRKYVSVTVSPGGLGKTSNSIVEALSMASGKALAGVKPPQRLRVWLFNAEDPRDEMERRIMAACLHFGLKPADIEGHLFLDSGREQELVVMKEDKKTGVTVNVPIVKSVVANIERHGVDVLVVDPFVSTHGVNENDNGAIDKVAKLWAQIADHTNCAVDVVHHLRKVSDREATVEDARGAVALIGAARSVRVLNRMSEDQAKAAAVPIAERFSYFSINYGKSNLTPLSHRLDWRKLESVALGNGRGLAKPQDHAPVVTEWQWPDAEQVVERITDDQMEQLKTIVDNENYKEGNRAKNWVGRAIAYAMGLDIDDDGDRQLCASTFKALLAEGHLVKSEEHDPLRREKVVFIRSNRAAQN